MARKCAGDRVLTVCHGTKRLRTIGRSVGRRETERRPRKKKSSLSSATFHEPARATVGRPAGRIFLLICRRTCREHECVANAARYPFGGRLERCVPRVPVRSTSSAVRAAATTAAIATGDDTSPLRPTIPPTTRIGVPCRTRDRGNSAAGALGGTRARPHWVR